ncbi:enoyl-CoA hydratase-related protein [Mangrovicoccus ximenensis]|uniref:enoyl-CoA hydratase-related protein n=1 Tax=Mangrovicoccus ximenensis TaxID=1911570 RepID=UPI000D3AE77B|nr:enoyl-CoA hydratase-related protein [Mangrovicoccus ximenensis]
MDYETIALETAEGVAVIRLGRPDRKNALNTRMRAELLHALKAAEPAARAIVITGSGDAFCAGQDLADKGNAASLDIERTLRDEYEPLLRAIHDCRLPVIAAVNGAAAGAGANLALSADVVIAAERAVFLQAFSRIGLIPDAGGTYWLPRQMGFAKAMGAMLFADPVTARQAEAWGMIWQAVPDAEFETVWRGRAAQLAQGPTEAYARMKQALRASFENGLDAQLRLEAHLQGECGRTRDFTEGVMAFLEKRPARFEGR